MKVLGLIPARGGSKGIPRKNLAPVKGKPLLAYTIEAALASERLSRTLVSTDDAEIAEVARGLGAECPFLRPPELARDSTPALPVIQHAVRHLEREGWRADCVVYLQPTCPLRKAHHIDEAVRLLARGGADSVVSVIPVPHQFHPVSALRLEDGCLVPFLDGQAAIQRRQDKPAVYARNGPAVLVATYETLMIQGRLYGDRTHPLFMSPGESLDIDSPEDLVRLEELLDRGEA